MRAIRTPFNVVGGSVDFTRSQTTVAEQKIIDVLSTLPAERLGVQGYGIGLSNLLFEPIDELVQSDLKVEILTELRDRISGITLHDVRFASSYDEGVLDVTVVYSLPLGTTQEVSLTLDVGTLTEESPL